MLEQAVQLFNEWLAAFASPQKRMFWGYLLSAFVIAVIWYTLNKKFTLLESLKAIFSKQAWLSRSAQADYLVMMINTVIMTVFSTRLLAKATVAYFLFNSLHQVFDGRPNLVGEVPDWLVMSSFTLFLFVLDDFARYWLHRWLHTIPVLWAFHKVHHSANALNPFTVFRTHPVEGVLFSLRSTLVQGVSIALFFFVFGDQVTLLTIIGANIFSFFFNLLGSNLRHSPVSISYWKPVEKLFISPAQHHIHHSMAIEHRDKNFGVVLAVWDRLFSSHCFSIPDQKLQYGIDGVEENDSHTLKALYWQPLVEAWVACTQFSLFNRFVTYFMRG